MSEDRGTESTISSQGLDSTVDSASSAPASGTDDTLASNPSAAAAIKRPADYAGLAEVSPDHYVLLDALARGGMGQVTRAHDRRLGREVAIKSLIRHTPELAARLEREARITARLHHPAIVNVHEAGVWPGGEPFYAMELVAGRPFGDVIGKTRSLDERLALLPHVIAVADALAYAHSKQVIHRDLKPSNVLVGEFGETVVIDWGLAKRLDHDSDVVRPAAPPPETADDIGSTVAGAVVGTPSYMPPEQAKGEAVDARADVYAIGAMLYHLLAGAPPYVANTTAKILAAVLDGPPRPIRDAAPGVPEDLVTIIAKAMAREPADRYPSGRQLAEDLKKFQTGQLVGAHRYTRRELVARWVRRHRAQVTIGGLALAALAVVGVVSIQRIVAEKQRTAEQRETAEDLMSFMLQDLGDKLDALGKLPLLESVANKAVIYYDGRGDGLDRNQQLRRSYAHRALAIISLQGGNATRAVAEMRAAIAIVEAVPAEPDDVGLQVSRADARLRMADVLRSTGDLREGMAELERALAIVAPLPSQPNTDEIRASLHERLGVMQLQLHEPARALEHLTQAQVVLDRQLAETPNDIHAIHRDSLVHGDLGDAKSAQHDRAGALAEYRTSLALAERRAALDSTSDTAQRYAVTMSDRVAETLYETGDIAGAVARYRDGIARMERLSARDPSNFAWQSDLGISHATLADALLAGGDQANALDELRAALAIHQALVARDPANTDWQYGIAHHQISIGEILVKRNDPAAKADYSAALSRLETVVAAHPDHVPSLRLLTAGYQDLAEWFEDRNEWQGAIEVDRKRVAIAENLLGRDSSSAEAKQELGFAHVNLGNAQLALGQLDAAVASFRTGVKLRSELATLDPKNVDYASELARAKSRLGQALLAQGKRGDALAELRAALAIYEPLPADGDRKHDIDELRSAIARASR